MAKSSKKQKKVLTPEQKKVKREAQAKKYETPVDKYVVINETGEGASKITTEAMHIRNMGCLVRTTTKNSVSEVFVPGCKIKTKKAWKTLVIDKPKK